MPELPEVETTRRGLAPLAEGRRIAWVTVRQPQLRWAVPDLIGALRDEPVLAPHTRLYHRLLAGDLSDSVARAEEELEEAYLADFYGSTAVPALSYPPLEPGR